MFKDAELISNVIVKVSSYPYILMNMSDTSILIELTPHEVKDGHFFANVYKLKDDEMNMSIAEWKYKMRKLGPEIQFTMDGETENIVLNNKKYVIYKILNHIAIFSKDKFPEKLKALAGSYERRLKNIYYKLLNNIRKIT